MKYRNKFAECCIGGTRQQCNKLFLKFLVKGEQGFFKIGKTGGHFFKKMFAEYPIVTTLGN